VSTTIPNYDPWNKFAPCITQCDAGTGWINNCMMPHFWQIYSPEANPAWPALNEPDTFLKYQEGNQPLYSWIFDQVFLFQWINVITSRGQDLVPPFPEAMIINLKFTHFGIPLCPSPTLTNSFILFDDPPTLSSPYIFESFITNDGAECNLINPPVYIWPANCRCGLPESIVAELPES